MNNKHLADNDIQRYVFDNKEVSQEIIRHISVCGKCKTQADFYRLLSTEIEVQKKPIIESDLIQSIMSKLANAETAPSKFSKLIWIYPIIIFFSVLVAGYIYGGFLIRMLHNVPNNALYLILTTASAFLLFQGIELFMKYKKQLEMLDIKRLQH